MDVPTTLSHLVRGGTLSQPDARALFSALLAGNLAESQIGAILGIIAARDQGRGGPTHDELIGAGLVMREHVTPTPLPAGYTGPVLDTCGTGGAPKTFNISTAAAIVAASVAGRRMLVAKHGNRSRSGRGSAEVLEALGVKVDAPPAVQTRCLAEVGVCFCFAVKHHPAMKHASAARLALGFPTIFNLLGPLTNPARADRQAMGVYAERYVEPMATALLGLGATRAMVFHSRDGMDELSVSAPTRIAEVRHGRVTTTELDPSAPPIGLPSSPREALEVSTLAEAADAVRSVLAGAPGPRRDAVLLAAAAALMVTDLAPDWPTGVAMAREGIDAGHAARTLADLAKLSHQPA